MKIINSCAIFTELLRNTREEELNSIIMELRKNYISLQEKVFQEESDKLV